MALKSQNREVREFEKFVESPTRPTEAAVETVVGNAAGDGIPVIAEKDPTLIMIHTNGIVVNNGTPVTVTPPSGIIKSIIIQNPAFGPNRNGSGKVLLISFDDGVTYFSISNGGSFTAELIEEPSIKIDSNRNNTKFEIIMEHDS